MKTLLLLCVAALVASVPALAQEREWVSYNEFLKMTQLDKFYDAPPARRDKIRMRSVIDFTDKSIRPADMVFVIVRADRRERIPVSADGQFDVPFSAAMQSENPMVHTNIPKGAKAALGFTAYAIVPDGLTLPYATLMAGVKQGNELIKTQAGILRMFAPKFDGVEIHFAKPAQQSLQILSKAGTKTLPVDAKGGIAVKLDEALLRENPQVVFSERPVDVEITE